MSETIKPRSKTRGGRRAPRPDPAGQWRPPDHPGRHRRLQAIALPEADGGFTVVIPALGCATQGDTIEEAQVNAVEAAEGWLTSQHKRMKDEAIRATQG